MTLREGKKKRHRSILMPSPLHENEFWWILFVSPGMQDALVLLLSRGSFGVVRHPSFGIGKEGIMQYPCGNEKK